METAQNQHTWWQISWQGENSVMCSYPSRKAKKWDLLWLSTFPVMHFLLSLYFGCYELFLCAKVPGTLTSWSLHGFDLCYSIIPYTFIFPFLTSVMFFCIVNKAIRKYINPYVFLWLFPNDSLLKGILEIPWLKPLIQQPNQTLWSRSTLIKLL